MGNFDRNCPFFKNISGLLNTGKVDIEEQKVDIQSKKVDIESVLSNKGTGFSLKTTIHIHSLFEFKKE